MEAARVLWRTVRRLAREPGFTLGALLLLGLGSGLTTAGFGVLDRLLWRPIAGVQAIDRVVALYTSEGGQTLGVSSYVDLEDLGARSHAFSAVASYKRLTMELTGAGGHPASEGQGEVLTGMLVSGSYFRVLGLAPARGRFFTAEEAGRQGTPAVVLGYDLWQRRFGGQERAIGRRVSLDGLACTVVGVAPPDFGGTSEDLRASLFVPMTLQPRFMGSDLLAERGWGGVLGIARLAPHASLAQAKADLRHVSRELEREYPDTNAGRTMSLEPLAASHLSALQRTIWQGASAMLAVTLALVLLVACTNVATLLAARAVARRDELGIRRTLGATAGRLARELALEALVLALGGGALGLLVALAALAVAARAPLQALQAIELDGRALVVAVAVTLLSALLAALSPLRELRRQLSAPLRATGTARSRGRAFGVALQVAISLFLLVGTTLLGRTLANLQSVPLGFDPHGLVVAGLGARAETTSVERIAQWRDIADAVRAVPGVRAAALSSRLPGGEDFDQLGVRVAGREQIESIGMQAVGGDYFRALGLVPLRGRGLDITDERHAAPVTVVNESLARHYWPGEPALGRTLDVVGQGTVTVVGVVPDSKDGELRRAPAPLFYVPWTLGERPPRELYLLARAAGEAKPLVPAVRSAAIAAGAGRARQVGLFTDFLATVTARERTGVTLLGALSALSLLLTFLGLYSLLAWTVAQRTRELGVRAALGADRARLRRLVVGRALRLAAAGAAAGTLGGLAVARAARGVLFGIGPYDPLNLLLPVALLLAVAILAAWLPARRATRIDPMAAIRG